MSDNPTPFALQIASDVICPWCYIGKRSLDKALARLAEKGVDIDVEWMPYQLNPTMPPEGMDRRTFRSARFGSWANASAMDARAVAAGRAVGAVFDYDAQTRTPSTLAAHALSRLAYAEGGSSLQHDVIDALFVAYFAQGRDIGDHAVLDAVAVDSGMSPGAVERSIPLRAEIPRLERAVRDAGITAVPSYMTGGRLLFAGSQDVDGYVRLLEAAAVAAAWSGRPVHPG